MSGLRARFVVAGGVIVALIGVIFTVLVVAIGDLQASADDGREARERLIAGNALQRRVIDMETGLRAYLITPEPRFLEPFDDARGVAPAEARQLARRVQGNPAQLARMETIERAIADYLRGFAEPLIRRVEGGPVRDPQVAVSEGKRRIDAIREVFARFLATEQATADVRTDEAAENADRAIVAGILGFAGTVALVVLLMLYLSRVAIDPLRRVARAARGAAEGDLSARVEETGSGEAREVAHSFNTMAGTLRENRDELESQNAELERQQSELEHAVEQLGSEKAEIELVQAFGERLTEEVELEALAEIVLTDLCRIARADVGVLYARGREERSREGATRLAQRGITDDRLPAHLEPGQGLPGRALAERRPVTARYEESELRVHAWGERVAVRAEAHLPLRQSDRHVGVVSLARISDDPFSAHELENLELLTAQAAIALSNARALQIARHQARLNRSVLETARDAYIAYDEDLRINAFNPAAERLFGWSGREATGEDLLTVLTGGGEDETGLVAAHEAFLEAGGDDRFEVPLELVLRQRDGSPFEAELVISPLASEDGWVFNAFLRDVAERKRDERQGRAQSAVNRALVDARELEDAEVGVVAAIGESLGFSLGALWRVDPVGDVLRLGSVWAAEDVDAAELEKRSAGAVVTLDRGIIGQVWARGEPVWIRDVEHEPAYLRAETLLRQGLHRGVMVPFRGSGEALGVIEFYGREPLDEDPSLVEVLQAMAAQVGVYVERRESERNAERLKDQFFALVSHELRTPLTSIIGYLELVLDDSSELDDRDRRFLTVVDRNAKRLLRLVGDLLFVAHVEAGRLALEVGRVDLEQLTREAVEAARPRAEARRLALDADTVSLPVFTGDRDRLGQVLDNLVGNALKFTPEGGRVRVKLHEVNGAACIDVIDNGMGIPRAEQERLFERFFRASTATDQAIPGVGLGLTIAKAIVEAHGGEIEVDSVEGAGTTFRFSLPLDRRPDGGRDTSGAMGEVSL